MNSAVVPVTFRTGTRAMPLATTSRPPVPAMPSSTGANARAQGGGGSLARHVQHCARARGRWFGVRVAAGKVHDALSPRFFTTILIASGVICLLVEWV